MCLASSFSVFCASFLRAARSGLLRPVFAGCCQRLPCPPSQPERPRRQPEQPLFQCLQGRPQKPFGPKSTEKGAARHIPPQHAPRRSGRRHSSAAPAGQPPQGPYPAGTPPAPDRKHRAHAAQHKAQQGAGSRLLPDERGCKSRCHQRSSRDRKPPGVRAAVYSTVSMRPVSFTSPLSRSRLVTLSCAPGQLQHAPGCFNGGALRVALQHPPDPCYRQLFPVLQDEVAVPPPALPCTSPPSGEGYANSIRDRTSPSALRAAISPNRRGKDATA